MQCCNIYDSYPSFQDGLKYEQARLEEDAVIQQKYKVLSFAIVAALYIFLVPSTSHANFTTTHTPGETVGPQSRAPIPHASGKSGSQNDCEKKMIQAEGWYAEGKSFRKKIREMGLGYVTRYIQSVGGYCYYYKGGTSSGPSGPNTW